MNHRPPDSRDGHYLRSTPLMDIYVETLSGVAFEMRALPFETVHSLKARIYKLEGIPVCQQHLVYGEIELEDRLCLIDYAIPCGATLKLVLGLRGGPVSTRRFPLTKTEDMLAELAGDALRDSTTGDESDSSPREPPPPPMGRMTVFVFQEGEHVNLFRVVDNGDGSFSPVSGDDWTSTSSLCNMDEDDEELLDDDVRLRESERHLRENAVTMNKMRQLKQSMARLNIKKKNKKKDLSNLSKDAMNSARRPPSTHIGVKLPPVAPIMSSPLRLPHQTHQQLITDELRWTAEDIRNNKLPQINNNQMPTRDLSRVLPHHVARPPPPVHGMPRTLPSITGRSSRHTPRETPTRFSRLYSSESKSSKKKLYQTSFESQTSPTPTIDVDNSDVVCCDDKSVHAESRVTTCEKTTKISEEETIRKSNTPSPAPSCLSDSLPVSFLEAKAEEICSLLRRRRKSDTDVIPFKEGDTNAIYPSRANVEPQDILNLLLNRRIKGSVSKREGLRRVLGTRAASLVEKDSSVKETQKKSSSPATVVKFPPSSGIRPTSSRRIGSGKTNENGRPGSGRRPSGHVISTPVKKKSGRRRSAKQRCSECHKRLGLSCAFSCRCQKLFCARHRYAETHACVFDYKREGREILTLANPLITATKLPKI